MTSHPPTDRARLLRLAVLGLLAAAVAWLALGHLRLTLFAPFALDEFEYAHAGWRIARGDVIYRDFFEAHHPLLMQLAALLWLGLDDQPVHLGTLRFLMLPVLALAIAAACVINRRFCRGWSAVTAVVLLMIPTLSSMATQLRPDPLAAALFLAALAVLYGRRLAPAGRGLLAGTLLVATFWGTLKVVYYGLAFPAALLADLQAGRREERGGLLGSPAFFLLGTALGLVPIALYLSATGTWDDWYRWCIAFAFRHQEHYPGFPWQRNFGQLVRHSFWLLPAAAVGVAATVRRLAGRADAGRHPDLLLLASLPATFVSFAWQTAAYLYSLVPFTLVLGIFAARGLVAATDWSLATARRQRGGVFVAVALALLFAGELRRAGDGLRRLLVPDNSQQIRVLGRLGAMTDPEDAVFHPFGGQISRPAVHYFYFLEPATRLLEEERLRRELVPAMIEHRVTVYLHDRDLFPRLVPELQAYLLGHFLPYDETIWVWGRRYAAGPSAAVEGDFVARRDGRHFVWPPAAAADLLLDGRPAGGPIFDLAAGRHRVAYDGGLGEIFILWLPRDGRPFPPRPELLSR